MPATPEHILVVNHNGVGRNVTSRIFDRAGYRVTGAVTGEEALRLIEQDRPNLVVLDVNLPGMSDAEFCRRIKGDPDLGSIPVLQVSATNVASVDRIAALDAGADSFLVEPVEAEELLAVSRALLRLQRAEAALRQLVAERDLLLREVNHRVKNSLQLVISMFGLQSRKIDDPSVRSLFEQAVSRILAIASVHERLYLDDNPLTVDMGGYLRDLCKDVHRTMGAEAFELNLDLEAVSVPTERAISLAVIVNELVTNALKHANPSSGSGRIDVAFRRESPGMLRLVVADGGTGPPNSAEARQDIGMQMVHALVQQLQGSLESDGRPPGLRVTIAIPDSEAAA